MKPPKQLQKLLEYLLLFIFMYLQIIIPTFLATSHVLVMYVSHCGSIIKSIDISYLSIGSCKAVISV